MAHAGEDWERAVEEDIVTKFLDEITGHVKEAAEADIEHDNLSKGS